MRGYGRNIGAALLLTLFAGYWSCITLFPHAHDVNGHVIVHSHPFSGASNGAAQTHTPQQFQLIAHLSLLVMTAAATMSPARSKLNLCGSCGGAPSCPRSKTPLCPT